MPKNIDGPIGQFAIPSEPPETARVCEVLSKAVWAGEYDHGELPGRDPAIRHIIDIGAGWGAFAVWAYSRWGHDIEIDCYEPHLEAWQYLRVNAPKVNAFVGAVTTERVPVLQVVEDWGSCKTYTAEAGRTVPAVHPAHLPSCDILKIDAEGVEPEILEYYSHMRTLKALIYEFHSLEHKAMCRQICREYGMRQIREDNEGTYGTSIWVAS
jgi:FkbM family methyltransferase